MTCIIGAFSRPEIIVYLAPSSFHFNNKSRRAVNKVESYYLNQDRSFRVTFTIVKDAYSQRYQESVCDSSFAVKPTFRFDAYSDVGLKINCETHEIPLDSPLGSSATLNANRSTLAMHSPYSDEIFKTHITNLRSVAFV